MDPKESSRFIRVLFWAGVFWFAAGTMLTRNDPEAMSAFFQIYTIILLDLVFLILLFWQLFFVGAAGRKRRVLAFLFFTFKLVCLGLLAITLKRLRNAPTYALALGVLFIAAGPMLAGVLNRIQKGNSKRDSKF